MEKPHTCKICNKSFTRAGDVKRHLLIHTGKKPCICKICNKSFAYSSYLKGHLMTHTGEKPHSCNICNKNFTQAGHLRSHVLTHTGAKPHTCKICNNSFARVDNLKSHLLRHTGETPHTCKICNMSFTWPSTVKRHLLTHTGDKSRESNTEHNNLSHAADLRTNTQVESCESNNIHKTCDLQSFSEHGNFSADQMIKEECKMDDEYDNIEWKQLILNKEYNTFTDNIADHLQQYPIKVEELKHELILKDELVNSEDE